MLVCSILNEKLKIRKFTSFFFSFFFLGGGGGGSDFLGLHLHNGAKRQLPEDGVWRVVTVYYFRHCAILLSVSGYNSAFYRGL